jgi:hypothetical protein
MAGAKLGLSIQVLPKAKRFGGTKGTIIKANANGSWDVQLIDGKVVLDLKSQQLKVVSSAVAAAPSSRQSRLSELAKQATEDDKHRGAEKSHAQPANIVEEDKEESDKSSSGLS